jgi:hypothetical protein
MTATAEQGVAPTVRAGIAIEWGSTDIPASVPRGSSEQVMTAEGVVNEFNQLLATNALGVVATIEDMLSPSPSVQSDRNDLKHKCVRCAKTQWHGALDDVYR